MKASLVMRDRETDSWWSIMTSSSIGGDMEHADLVELPYAEKTTWADWVARYPDTVVLSVDGEEHVAFNPYDKYLAGDETFRNLKINDLRLEPKEPIFSFWVGEQPYAVAHSSYQGGRLFEVEELDDKLLLLYRTPGAAIFESTQAFLVPRADAKGKKVEELLSQGESGAATGIETFTGFDTFWYTWIAVHEGSKLLE